ncbi:MAG TPA: carboxypeptidase-like regulatory domain-containing protein [Gemmatimonadaceae bacterium]|nr:carboxypeptidase-like regulatory domain-containing protein [Gemmatimonadaceae bacterium]
MTDRSCVGMLTLLVSCLAFAPVGAQVVRGSVVDSATSRPLGDFTVQLIDSGGVGVAAALAQPGGRFNLRAPAAGTYRLRVLRIGFRRTETASFALGAGETLERTVSMPQISVALASIRIVGAQRCEDLPEGGDALATVWEEARKAVEAVRLTGSEQRLRMRVRDYTHDLSLRGDVTSNEESREREGISAHPYVSPDAESMARDGYVRQEDDGTTYYAPDAGVLLSDAFVSAHCFHLQRDAVTGDSLIGIAFEPVRRRPPPDIRGVLYLDRRSAELRELRYTYTSLPAAAVGRDFGGRVAFQRVPGGAWIIRAWAVRGPVFVVKQQADLSTSGLPVRGMSAVSRGLDSSLAGMHVGGGEVLVARTVGGATVWARAYGSVRGTVTDSATGTAIAGAQVELRGTMHQARTDSTGTFRLDSVPPGAYTLLVNVLTPVRFARSLAVRMDSGQVRASFVLPVSTLARERSAREAVRLAAQCAELRAARNREIDAALAEPVEHWAPRGRDSAQVRRRVEGATVVLQAVADTTGRIERGTVRVLRGGTNPALSAVRAALYSLAPEVEEPVPGCRLRRMILLPYRRP